ncbi:MAG: hypothetical protein E6356_16885 [Terrisporobacter othiniensis]|nr:hypothetical protein [Terrisporobacter othiniensis]
MSRYRKRQFVDNTMLINFNRLKRPIILKSELMDNAHFPSGGR